MMSKDIIQKLRDKALDPEAALKQFEIPSRHISDGSIDDLQVLTLDCGFESLNRCMAFKQEGELVILGARPSMGKSAFLLQVALHIAKTRPVLFFSLEMSYKALKRRALALESGKSLKRIQEGTIVRKYLQDAHDRISKLQLHIDDHTDLNINQICGRIKDFHKQFPLGLVVIDYLQKIPNVGTNRADEVAKSAQALKKTASELKLPIFVAAQLNRSCEERGHKAKMFGKQGDYRPMGSDIGESDKVQHIADVIIFLSRQEVYDGSRRGEADVGVYKNRDGETKWLVFDWDGSLTKFNDRQMEAEAL